MKSQREWAEKILKAIRGWNGDTNSIAADIVANIVGEIQLEAADATFEDGRQEGIWEASEDTR
jgi:hypothetical protein